MTTHYIIPCSAKKAMPPANGLSWMEDTTFQEWKSAWDQASERLPVSSMYTGYSITKSLENVRESSGDWKVWVVSAGMGLFRGPSSTDLEEDLIPGYDVHCFPSRPMTPRKMRELWEGKGENCYNDPNSNSWTKIEKKEGDKLVLCLPISYQKAVLPSLVEHVATASDIIGIGRHLKNSDRVRSLGVHPRIREVLGCGFSMMRTVLLEKWVTGGDEELERLDSLASKLNSPPLREKISDTNLRKLISEADPEITTSISKTIRWVRDECRISASEERIKLALR